jgi:hypothetical protein
MEDMEPPGWPLAAIVVIFSMSPLQWVATVLSSLISASLSEPVKPFSDIYTPLKFIKTMFIIF